MDKIFHNGIIGTMDRDRTLAEAVAVKDGKIALVGTNEEVLASKSSSTELIDLQGRLMLPGFNDSHLHLLGYGLTLQQVDLIGSTSAEDIVERTKKFLEEKQIPEGEWIRGRGWNNDYFIDGNDFPTRHDLDKISTRHPIILTRTCGHALVVNSKALELAGVDKNTKPLEGGTFEVDEEGNPTGVFGGTATALVSKDPLNPDIEDIKKMLLDAMANANKCGLTSVHSDDLRTLGVGFEEVIRAYEELRDSGQMTLRVYQQCGLGRIEWLNEFFDKGYSSGYGDEVFKLGSLKLLADGSLGSRTAALTKAYADDPTNKGIVRLSQDQLDVLVEKAHINKMPVAIHGIGDRSIYMIFEAIEKAVKKHPREDHRHGVIHCQITDEALLNKFKDQDVIAYIQPIFIDYDWKIVEDRVGEELTKTSYNWKTLGDKGVPLAMGSDCPVESFDVLNGIYAAVTRQDLNGQPQGGWLPKEKLSLDQALYGFTMGSAYASFEEDIKGSIEEGKLADMVILSDNIYKIDENKIKDVEVQATIFNGNIVYKKEKF